MANGIRIIREELLNSLFSLSGLLRGFLINILGGSDELLLVRVDDETRSVLAEFSEQNMQPVEEAAAGWLMLQAGEYKQDREVGQHWASLSDREQKVVALCCLGYSDWEVADALGIAYGTARAHLYNAIYKLGISKKSQLLFLLRNWDFSQFDRDFSKRA